MQNNLLLWSNLFFEIYLIQFIRLFNLITKCVNIVLTFKSYGNKNNRNNDYKHCFINNAFLDHKTELTNNTIPMLKGR